MRYLGIDIGKSGGIASIDGDDFYVAFDMPVFTTKKGKSIKRHIDKMALFHLLKELKTDPILCFIERNRPYPREGVISSFTLGEQVGLIQGMLIGLDIGYEIVMPQTWYKEFSIVKQGETKNASYEKASALFPRAILQTERGRILDGRCDALLIAEFGRRRRKGDGQESD